MSKNDRARDPAQRGGHFFAREKKASFSHTHARDLSLWGRGNFLKKLVFLKRDQLFDLIFYKIRSSIESCRHLKLVLLEEKMKMKKNR